jgi:hypothetical protein
MKAKGRRHRVKIIAKIFIYLLVAAHCLLPTRSSEAQQPAKVVRAGFLIATSASTEKSRSEAFQHGLR